ncbi:MAG: TonB-dependent receptor [Acidobacteriota bacterium]
MRAVRLAVLFVCAVAAFAQSDRATITGTVVDPSGAVLANAEIEARNAGTGQITNSSSTATGNFTLGQLPAGTYDLTINVSGFKRYNRPGLVVSPTQVLRIDVAMEVGSSTESVTVTAEATLLKTESGEVGTAVTDLQLNRLPLLGVGPNQASAAGIRNPWAMALLVPGAQYSVGGFFGGTPNLIVNGAQANTASYRVEGMEAGNSGTLNVFTMEVQPSAEAIQEVAVQTSNFAAEYGAVGGGLFNASMKSGGNAYHGSLYEYFVNEKLNASQPYTALLDKARRHDYGIAMGGPIRIPKIYNGSNKTFFFFNWEQFYEKRFIQTSIATVPTAEYRNGDFGLLPARSGSGTAPLPLLIAGNQNYIDPLGRIINSGTIFDPTSQVPVTCAVSTFTPTCSTQGQTGSNILTRNPYPLNAIPLTKLDSVATTIQSKYIELPVGPNATRAGLNFNKGFRSRRSTEIPSLKLDQNISTKGHLSFYWSATHTADQYPAVGSPGVPEGFKDEITTVIANFDRSYTMRANYDHTLTPTLLLHLGAGFQQNKLWDWTPILDFNPLTAIGLKGIRVNRSFPRMTFDGVSAAVGGMNSMGALFQTQQMRQKPQANTSLTWVRDNHTFKIGGEWRIDGNPELSYAQPPWHVGGVFGFTASATNQPALEDVAITRGSTGFSYASFLLGRSTSFGIGAPAAYRQGRQQWATFIQDTWKVTRKLTLDYGIRYDWGGYVRDTYGRIASFGANLANVNAGGHPGGVIYEATCGCRLAANYPYSLGPRASIAYQINNRTVLRAGFGIVYNTTTVAASSPLSYQLADNPAFGQAQNFTLQDGVPASFNPQFPNLSAAALPALPNTVSAPPGFIDPNVGRPARQYQWSIGLQREINRNLVVEASYVANRGVWWANSLLAPNNSISQSLLAKYGFVIGNTTDASLLGTQLRNLTTAQRTTLAGRGVNTPYNGFPGTQTVQQSILPFPQYTGNITPANAPLGKTWYDSLQLTVTQRLWQGLSVNANYTYSKNLELTSSPDIYNRSLGKNISANDLPHQLRISAQYVTPKVTSNRIVSTLLADWTMGWFLQYQSPPALGRPVSLGQNAISRWLNRGPGPAQWVAGQSLFTTNWVDLDGKARTDELDLNCHCYDPRTTQVLNPSAWANIPDVTWGQQQQVIRQFRGYRYPTENLNVGRTFRIHEGIQVNVRAEFSNVFNRVRLPQPTSGGSALTPIARTNGIITGGFGSVVPTNVQNQRQGTIVARLTF